MANIGVTSSILWSEIEKINNELGDEERLNGTCYAAPYINNTNLFGHCFSTFKFPYLLNSFNSLLRERPTTVLMPTTNARIIA
jgi:hypothetical protein